MARSRWYIADGGILKSNAKCRTCTLYLLIVFATLKAHDCVKEAKQSQRRPGLAPLSRFFLSFKTPHSSVLPPKPGPQKGRPVRDSARRIQ